MKALVRRDGRALAITMLLLTATVAALAAACGGPRGESDAPGAPSPGEAATGEFAASGKLPHALRGHVAVLMSDGRVLIAGGRSEGEGAIGAGQLDTAAVYDAATGAWTAIASMASKREKATAHLLRDGRVLVTGGRSSARKYLKTTEIYDPETAAWSKTDSMHESRYRHASVLLPDGRVLVTGGQNTFISLNPSTQLFDPASESWSPASAMSQGRSLHSATLLSDGRVLVVGSGRGGVLVGGPYEASSELYHPDTDTWSSAGMLSVGRADHTATLLRDGRVLVAGGEGDAAEAELYDPAANTWSTTGPMSEARSQHAATLLADGRVLVTGGADEVDSAEVYDPDAGVWSAAGTMTVPRYLHTATLLADGTVLLAGGKRDRFAVTDTSEVYQP